MEAKVPKGLPSRDFREVGGYTSLRSTQRSGLNIEMESTAEVNWSGHWNERNCRLHEKRRQPRHIIMLKGCL